MDARPRRSITVAIATVLAFRAAWLLSLAWPFTSDDALISVRYARHVAAGHGFVWNLGEPPLEGYSNFLTVMLDAMAARLGFDPVLTVKVLGIMAVAAALILVYRIARLWLAPMGALVPVAIVSNLHGVALWGASGMETTTYVAVTLFAVLLAFQNLPIAAGLAVTVAGMVRPEGPLVGIAIGLGYLVTQDWRSLLRFTGAAIPPYAVYFGWRLWMFGRPFPNTVYCKANSLAAPWAVSAGVMAVAVPCLILLLGSKLDRRHTVALALAALYVAILYRVDTAVSSYHRFDLAPSILLLTVTAGTVVSRLTPRMGSWLTALVIAFCVLFPVAPLIRGHAQAYLERQRSRAAVAEWLNARLGPTDAYVMGDVGLVGNLTERRLLDALCLTSSTMTRPPIDRDPSRYAAWLLAQSPQAVVISSKSAVRLIPAGTLGVFPALLAQPGFSSGYSLDTVLGRGTGAQYWVFSRRAR